MAIHVTCSCGARLRASPENAGKRARCSSCGTSLTIPKPRSEVVEGDNPLGPLNSDPLGVGMDCHAATIATQAPSPRTTPIGSDHGQGHKRRAANELLRLAAAELHEREQSSPGFSVAKMKRIWKRSTQLVKAIIVAVGACAAFVGLAGLFVPSVGIMIIGTVGVITVLAGSIGYICLIFHAFSDDDAASGVVMMGAFVVPFLFLYVYYYMLTRWEGTIPFWLVAGSLIGNVALLLYGMAFLFTTIVLGL